MSTILGCGGRLRAGTWRAREGRAPGTPRWDREVLGEEWARGRGAGDWVREHWPPPLSHVPGAGDVRAPRSVAAASAHALRARALSAPKGGLSGVTSAEGGVGGGGGGWRVFPAWAAPGRWCSAVSLRPAGPLVPPGSPGRPLVACPPARPPVSAPGLLSAASPGPPGLSPGFHRWRWRAREMGRGPRPGVEVPASCTVQGWNAICSISSWTPLPCAAGAWFL